MFKITTKKAFKAAVDKEVMVIAKRTGDSFRAMRLEKQMLEAEIAALKPAADKWTAAAKKRLESRKASK
jgi:hypothetical protein